MLGLYDSGLGGLTVLAALRTAGITEDVVYFADQAHVPYGDKTEAEIHGFLRDNLALLGEQHVDAVVTACNTSCAVAEKIGWPQTPFPVIDLIATAGRSFAQTPHRRIAVVATAATVRAGAYARAIRASAPHAGVIEIAAPKLVPLVEQGYADTDTAREAVAEIVAELPPDVDALVYGCTHYPLLDRWFAQLLNPHVDRIDPARAQAAATAKLIAERNLAGGTSTTTYYTNGDPDAFKTAVRRWTGDLSGRVAALIAR
ncbi:MAG: glutamate racemase [Candidatus Eremiobacteraeota bacterium]|nr:glutamate racemase [Candidatus Eremiobacteraeota bacterium]